MPTLAIVTGASPGKLGGAIIEELCRKNITCIGIARREVEMPVRMLIADLLNRTEVRQAISKIDFEPYDHLLLVHAVGKFKFEPQRTSYEGKVDDEIWTSNVDSVCSLFGEINAHKENWRKSVTLVTIGSLAEDYQIPYYRSYTESRLHIRKEMQIVARCSKNAALYIKTCTIKVPSEEALRPYADMTYWMCPHDFARRVVPFMLTMPRGLYIERDIYVGMPGFDPAPYYTDHQLILERWRHDMGDEAFNRLLEEGNQHP